MGEHRRKQADARAQKRRARAEKGASHVANTQESRRKQADAQSQKRSALTGEPPENRREQEA